jgi:hypothetical protein
MSNFDIQMILVWSLIALAYIVPPIMRKYGYTMTDGIFNSYLFGMYTLMMAAGATLSYILTNTIQ